MNIIPSNIKCFCGGELQGFSGAGFSEQYQKLMLDTNNRNNIKIYPNVEDSRKIRDTWKKQGIIPHYTSIARLHPDVWIENYTVNFFTDNAGNIIIFGENNADGSPFNALYNTGMLFKGYDKDLVQNSMKQVERETGEGWYEHTVNNALFAQGGETGVNWMQVMAQREAYGKVPFPYIYMINTVETSTVLEVIAPYVLIGLTITLSIFSFGLPSILATGLTSLVKLGNNYLVNGSINFKDLSDMALNMPGLVADKSITDTIKNYGEGLIPQVIKDAYDSTKFRIDIGAKLYEAYQKGDVQQAADALGLQNTSIAQDINNSAMIGDIKEFARKTGNKIEDAQKIVTTVQNCDTIANLTQFGHEIASKAQIYKRPFNDPSIQGFYKIAAAMPEVAAVIPGAYYAVQAVVNSVETKDDEYIAAIDMIQGKMPLQSGIDSLSIRSMLGEAERLRNAGARTYIVPNNISSELQAKVAQAVATNVRGVKVELATGKVKVFYPAWS